MEQGKKIIHLICNAHIDPIWQWDWPEGASATLSTFYSAVKLCREFDYVFCHNEVTVYKYVEEYAPELFAEIQELVKAGKWHIMGGWYISSFTISLSSSLSGRVVMPISSNRSAYTSGLISLGRVPILSLNASWINSRARDSGGGSTLSVVRASACMK